MRFAVLLVSAFLMSCVSLHTGQRSHPSMSTEACGLGSVNVLKVPAGTVDFTVSKKRPSNSDIYINSNFFDRRGPIGELIVKGKRLSSRVRGGGYFFVKAGRPGISAYAPPKNPDYSSQSILVAINDGKINRAMLRRGHARELTYRSLVGVDAESNLYIIASTRTGLITASEIVELARQLGVREAILPDAGSSVDYKLSDGHREASMKSAPGFVKRAMRIEEPKSYIVGNIKR